MDENPRVSAPRAHVSGTARIRRRAAWAVALAAAALAAGIAPIPAAAVDRTYSSGAYPAIETVLTSSSNIAPFALLDALIIAVAAGWIGLAARDTRRYPVWREVVASWAVRLVALAAALYLVFLATWGLNYRRRPLTETLQFDAGAVSQAAARRLALEAADRVNALYEQTPRFSRFEPPLDPDPRRGIDPRLAEAFGHAQRDLGMSWTAVPGRPKHTLLDLYFRRAGVDGMIDPFLLESLVTRDLLPFEEPFVIAHEWSHLAGYADEGTANFIGWLTCLRGSDGDRYSGWLFLYGEAVASLRPADRGVALARLAPGPREDRRAIAERFRRHVNPRVAAVGWTVYDRYLKANRIEAGTASYDEVIRLVLGTKFGPDWTPLQRRP